MSCSRDKTQKHEPIHLHASMRQTHTRLLENFARFIVLVGGAPRPRGSTLSFWTRCGLTYGYGRRVVQVLILSETQRGAFAQALRFSAATVTTLNRVLS